MSDWKRADRIAGELQKALARILQRGLRDPRITPISLTRVKVSDDLRIAHVTFLPLGGDGDAESIMAGLRAASGYLRRELGHEMKLRFVPTLHFHLDDQLDDSVRMVDLLERLERERLDESEE